MSDKQCLACLQLKYSNDKWKSRYEKLNWLVFNIREHMQEALKLGAPVDSIALADFIEKRLSELD